MRRASVFVLLIVVASLGIARLPATAAVGGCGGKPDFNGDGREDVAVGVKGQAVNGHNLAGSVHIIYGTRAGLTTDGDAVFHQDSSGMVDTAQFGDRFGTALASGDFDGDGFDDLAIGVPDEDVGGVGNAGGVHIMYGSSSGLTATGNEFLTRATTDMNGDPGSNEEFGTSVAACDFDGDERDDLAVGVPAQTVGSLFAGGVHVIYGTASGLTASGDQIFTQNTTGIDGVPNEHEHFGLSLVGGDFDNDGRDDLAVGIPSDVVSGGGEAGAIQVIYGSASGLTSGGDQLFHQNTSGIADAASGGERFGFALAAGDFDSDGRDDVAIGVPRQAVGGAVHVIYGSSAGLTSSGDQLLSQDTSGMADVSEASDNFAYALGAGDVDRDGRDDVLVGVPGQDVSGLSDAGAIHVIYGTDAGLTTSGDQVVHQNTTGIADAAGTAENFGDAVTAVDITSDGRDDAVVGIPRQSLFEPFDFVGAIHTIYGSSTGLTSTDDQFLHQDTAGMSGSADEGDRFGGALVGSPDLFGLILLEDGP